ncbi:hypothetical protein SFRURICE_005102 [Spodoptera frugiperda]|nr:hypothetical protein SFRURICE_005102 [Spodoptera frugiperda]
MPKSREEKLWKKLKKLEEKIKKSQSRRRRIRSLSSSERESVDDPDPNERPEVIEDTGTQQLQDDVLIALGNPSCSDKSYSESIHPEIIRRVENVLTSGLEKERKDELLKKYLISNNFALLEAPKLNRELEGLLSDPIKERDKRIEERQQQLGVALSAVLSCLDNFVKVDPNPAKIEVLTDVARLLSDLHYNDTCTRKKLVAVNLDKDIVKTTESAKRDSFLFGERFNEDVNETPLGGLPPPPLCIKKAAPSILKKSNFTRKMGQTRQSNYTQFKNKENFNAPPQANRAKTREGQVSTQEQWEAAAAATTASEEGISTQVCQQAEVAVVSESRLRRLARVGPPEPRSAGAVTETMLACMLFACCMLACMLLACLLVCMLACMLHACMLVCLLACCMLACMLHACVIDESFNYYGY